MPSLFTFRYFSLYTNTFQMHATRKNALAKVFYALEYDLQPLPKAVECGWLCGAPSCSNLVVFAGRGGDDGPLKRQALDRSTA